MASCIRVDGVHPKSSEKIDSLAAWALAAAEAVFAHAMLEVAFLRIAAALGLRGRGGNTGCPACCRLPLAALDLVTAEAAARRCGGNKKDGRCLEGDRDH